jgi:hypothetical protein
MKLNWAILAFGILIMSGSILNMAVKECGSDDDYEQEYEEMLGINSIPIETYNDFNN